MRNPCKDCIYYHKEFQPTRPLRGATNCACSGVIGRIISTHAPLAGRDRQRH